MFFPVLNLGIFHCHGKFSGGYLRKTTQTQVYLPHRMNKVWYIDLHEWLILYGIFTLDGPRSLTTLKTKEGWLI